MNPTVEYLLEHNLPVIRETYEMTATMGDESLLPGLEETMPLYVRNDELKDVPVSDPDYHDLVRMLEHKPFLTVELVRRGLHSLV